MNPDFQIGEYMLAEHDLFLRVFSKYLKISILLGRDGEYQFQRSRSSFSPTGPPWSKKNDAYSCSWFKISHCGTRFLKPRKQSQNEKERLIFLADCRQYTERLFCSVTPNKLQPTPA